MSKSIFSGDVTLWAESRGDDASPAILLVMGANACGMAWPDELVDLLVAGGFRAIRYDHRDTGRSTRRDFALHPYSLSTLAHDAVAVLDGFGVPKAHVVGLSMGGTIGQLLALDHRERLASLTLMMTAALDVDFVGAIGEAMRGNRVFGGLPTPVVEVLEVLGRRAQPSTDMASELERRVQEWRALCGPEARFDEDDFRRWEERVIAHCGSIVQPSAHAFATPVPTSRGVEMSTISTPTLVIQGMLDPLNPPPHGRHIAELIPGAKLLQVDGLGHALPRWAHKTLADSIMDHARSVIASARR